jgi:glutamyl endopeptidase
MVLFSSDLDRRVKIDNPDTWPYSVHGRLYGSSGGRIYLGSGTIIGTRYVLTAAHCVYSHAENQEFDISTIKFIPAMNGTSCPYGQYSAIQIIYPEEYKLNSQEDYAIVVLDRELCCYTGYFKLKEFERERLNNKIGGLYGYPTHMRNQEPNQHFLWGMDGDIQVDMMNHLIHHTLDTSAGQAGAAVFVEDDGEYYVVGVHVQGTSVGNLAVFMNGARIRRINEWIRLSDDARK